VLHPVGPLPAAVYWRRRLLVLTLLLAVLGGGGWSGWAAATGRFDRAATGTVGAAATTSSLAAPALERVMPSLASVQTPTTAPTSSAAPVQTAVAVGPPQAPVPGGPCGDDMIRLEIRTPASAPVGGKPTFELVVTNVSTVPCLRALDKGLQEMVLLDGAGNRVWGSNDCYPEASTDLRMLAPGEVVSFPLVWGGLTSEPTCTAPRVPPPPGNYLLRARLDTKVGSDALFAIV
jgi:hypothetical protein